MLFAELEDHLFDAPGTWSLRECADAECGWVWLDPLPDPRDLELLYGGYFTHAAREAGALRWLLEAAYAAVDFVPARLTGLAHARRESEVMYSAGLAPGRLLDVGCGDGSFLLHMQRQGWTVCGIDVDAQAIARAKREHGLDVARASLEEAKFELERFDLVTASHVIEHVADPVAFVRECLRIAAPGGRVVLVTPNLESLGLREFGDAWFGLDVPRHLQLFRMSTLERCVQRAGATRFRSCSTAANAAAMFAGSIAIASADTERSRRAAPAHVARPLQAARWQYREQRALRNDPISGEELVLVIEV